MVAVRRHGRRTWDGVVDLATVEGNPLAAPVAEDGHNFLSLGVDPGGHLHLCGNQHDDELRYVRSARPHDITAWERSSMLSEQDSVTYPKFFSVAGAGPYFLVRGGRSGLGNTYLNRYDHRIRRWHRVAELVDGVSCDRSFYPNHVSSRDGSIHVMGVWRGTHEAATTHDLTYFRSADGGRTWTRADGTPQPLPVTHDNAERVLATSPTGSGLLNGGGLEVDARGRPHGAILFPDDHGTQVQHIWHDGTRWHRRAVTSLAGRMRFEGGYTDNTVGHPAVAVTASDRVLVLYRARGHRSGAPLLVEATPGRPLREHRLLKRDLGFWNPVFDTRALYERNELHMLLVPTGNPLDPTVDPPPWADVEAHVISLRLR